MVKVPVMCFSGNLSFGELVVDGPADPATQCLALLPNVWLQSPGAPNCIILNDTGSPPVLFPNKRGAEKGMTIIFQFPVGLSLVVSVYNNTAAAIGDQSGDRGQDSRIINDGRLDFVAVKVWLFLAEDKYADS